MSNTNHATANHTPAPWKVSVWDYSLATPSRKELKIETSDILLATVECDHDENNPYIVPKNQAEANANLMAASPQLLDALRRLHCVASNHNQATGRCFCCGREICLPECAVNIAKITLDDCGPEFEEGWNSPVPPYDREIDGDYSSFLARNNCD